ncbi:MAG: molybdopterin-guanine dinucleotide biosynthesis protein MobB [Spirochaetales bacterium]|nr:molybdopterin-guanine dinucleotide biosynthesis protein MobB [Spirochaetales bacterium]
MKHHPTLICVTGLKNSGKTTVCTALIAELDARGFRVAALKSSHVAVLDLDHRGGDSYALAESGACFVLVQGARQSLIFERVTRSFAQMLDRVPEGTDFIVSEGCDAEAGAAADAAVIICLADAGAWEETLRVRRIPRDSILAVAGSFAAAYLHEAEGTAPAAGFGGFPLLDITRERDRKALVERILRMAG